MSSQSLVCAFLVGVYCVLLGLFVGRYSAGYGAKHQLRWLAINQDLLNAQSASAEEKALGSYLEQILPLRPRRVLFYQASSFVLFLWLMAISPSAGFFLSQLVIFSIFITLTALDLEDKLVPEAGLLWLAGAGIALHVLVPQVRWASSQSVILGFFSVLVFVLLAQSITRLLFRIPSDKVIFGDGDLFALLALAFFYGLDVLTVLGLSSLFFLLAYALRSLYKRALPWAGYLPQEGFDKDGMAMFPFLLLGLLTMVSVSLATSFDLTLPFEDLYSYYLHDLLKVE